MTTQIREEAGDPPQRAAKAAIRLSGVCHHYRTARGDLNDVETLDQFSLTVEADEVVAIVGPSGCGKTTLLELICGLQTPSAGNWDLPPATLMAQQDLLFPWLDALDNGALALRLQGLSREAAREAVMPLFAVAGLSGFERARPDQLSTGMRQRVAFVRTLCAGKSVLCLDEPFAALDAITRAAMRDWLCEMLEAEPRTVIFVTHDVEEAAMLADRIVLCAPRPSRVIAEIEVPLARPRSVSDPAIVEIRRLALEHLSR